MRNFEQSWLNEENRVWQWDEISPNVENDMPEFWSFLESKFGPGDPGFTETTKSVQSSTIFSNTDPVNVRWTCYRSETGELLCVHGCYINGDGYQVPFTLMVNPGHQRKGIGRLMVDFVRERFMNENGVDMDADIAFRTVKATPSGALFVNKYVNDDYAKRNAPNEV
ncbi:MAG: GNAT family N-acetyltransferase [Chitinophagales bacterium]|nr:GNAT family N-acetyltransferase [Chitinophagales bacterium]